MSERPKRNVAAAARVTDCTPDAPNSWERMRLAQVAKLNPPVPLSKDVEYPFIEMAAMSEGFGGITEVSSRGSSSGCARFAAGDLLVAKITPCLENGKVGLVPSHLVPDRGQGSTEFDVLRATGVSPDYLRILLISDAVRGRLSAAMEGSTGRQRVPEDAYRKRLVVAVPPSHYQDKAARLLSALDAQRNALVRQRQSLLDLRLTLERALFSGESVPSSRVVTALGDLPSSWTVEPLRDLIVTPQYGLSMTMHRTGDFPIVRMGDLQDGAIGLKDPKFVRLTKETAKPYLLHPGDLLFNRTNSAEWVGKIGLWHGEGDSTVFASYLVRLTPKASRVTTSYLAHYLRSEAGLARARRYASPAVQQVNISPRSLLRVLVPMPASAREMAAVTEPLDTIAEALASVRASEQILVQEYERVADAAVQGSLI